MQHCLFSYACTCTSCFEHARNASWGALARAQLAQHPPHRTQPLRPRLRLRPGAKVYGRLVRDPARPNLADSASMSSSACACGRRQCVLFVIERAFPRSGRTCTACQCLVDDSFSLNDKKRPPCRLCQHIPFGISSIYRIELATVARASAGRQDAVGGAQVPVFDHCGQPALHGPGAARGQLPHNKGRAAPGPRARRACGECWGAGTSDAAARPAQARSQSRSQRPGRIVGRCNGTLRNSGAGLPRGARRGPGSFCGGLGSKSSPPSPFPAFPGGLALPPSSLGLPWRSPSFHPLLTLRLSLPPPPSTRPPPQPRRSPSSFTPSFSEWGGL